MTKFAHDKVVPFEKSSLEKKEQVAQMFDSIAFRYDFLNKFLSAGIDKSWRKKAISELKNIRPKKIIDVAAGTADVAILTNKILHPEKIIGIDISNAMLEIGRKKVAALHFDNIIKLQNGDSEAINFADASFDAATVAFGVRNFQHLEKGLSEMYRVLQTGGKLVVLEFSQPKNKFFKALCSIYMNVITPQAGKIFAKNKSAYQYLNESVQAFPEREAFITVMKNAGFKNTYFKPLTLGICCIYCGSK